MASLKTIKAKIRGVEKTGKVTKAMEAVSAAKMRKAQTTAIAGRAYAKAAAAILARVSGSQALKNHPLVGSLEKFSASASGHNGNASGENFSSPKKALYIVITSDKGLAGALNSSVLRGTLADIMKQNLKPTDVSVVAIGRKAQDFFAARGFRIGTFHPNTDQISSAMIDEVLKNAAQRFTAGEVGVVKVAYQNFVSTFEQRPTVRTIFPLSLEELQKVVADILPARGAFAEAPPEKSPSVYTVEPSEEDVLNAILPRLASIFLYHALLESQASEHSARMVAMKSASDKAEELSDSLTLKFNKARQAAITREVSEITGGMEALSA
jgi:F-type H+-transporting ATPase subunit gamma